MAKTKNRRRGISRNKDSYRRSSIRVGKRVKKLKIRAISGKSISKNNKRSKGARRKIPNNAKVRFLIAFVMYNESKVTIWKRYGGGNPMFWDRVRDRIPLRASIEAYRDSQEADIETQYALKEIIMFCYAKNLREAKNKAVHYDNFKWLDAEGDVDEEFERDVETYRRFSNGRIYKNVNL